MKKRRRKIKKLKLTIFVLIIIFLIVFALDILSVRTKIFGSKIKISEENGYKITQIYGGKILLPKIFENEKISLIDNSKIIEFKTEENEDKIHNIYTLKIKTKKTKQEITDYYKQTYKSSMILENENDNNVIITGNANNLLKFLINEKEYTIVFEQK